MAKTRGRRYQKCLEGLPTTAVSPKEAIAVLKGMEGLKFDATVELVMHLGIDPRQADQAMRGSMSLPHGIGKTKKVIAFCDGDEAEKATAAGAIEVGGEELVKKITDGWMDFDVAIATPAMMKVVSKLGRVLGPTGKMPSPKAGTVTPDAATAVKDFAAGKVEYRNDDAGNMHIPIGKISFEADQLEENMMTFVNFVKKSRPSTVKGTYIKKVSISATMTPGIAVAVVS
ncbi:MAG: 50S ribosomal protein L1 [Phycisphaerae bacterium]|nr:50S ribosomal protein L1 [Phycisphaerae bacterium]